MMQRDCLQSLTIFPLISIVGCVIRDYSRQYSHIDRPGRETLLTCCVWLLGPLCFLLSMWLPSSSTSLRLLLRVEYYYYYVLRLVLLTSAHL
jgi:hypothetical protein